jgi:hypothetical protein
VRRPTAAVQSVALSTKLNDRFLYVTGGGHFDTSTSQSFCAAAAPRSAASTLIVQERRPRHARVKAQLAQVWDYWAPDLAPDRNGAARANGLFTGTR